ncbi:MAG TPA: ISL3 family transposase, partial [Nitrospirae bacterium]|nr:ISL3 family transposase [Nitrospirota bacterium]
MRDTELFQKALGLTPPWQVESSKFNLEQKRLDIMIDFPRGGTFTCPECGKEGLKAHDTEIKYW